MEKSYTEMAKELVKRSDELYSMMRKLDEEIGRFFLRYACEHVLDNEDPELGQFVEVIGKLSREAMADTLGLMLALSDLVEKVSERESEER